MKNLYPLAISVMVAVSFGCFSSSLPPLDPAKDQLLKKIVRAKCDDYAALYFENDYRWTVELYLYPIGRRLGEVMPASDAVFCIREQDLYEGYYLSIRIRSVADLDRRGGVVATTKPANVLRGEVWRFSVPSTSLEGWQVLLLPYRIETSK